MKSPTKHSSLGYKQLIHTIETALGKASTDRVKATLKLAIRGHGGQYRSSVDTTTFIPYIVHPVGVARIAIEYFDCIPSGVVALDDVICAALAHDLLEDTRVTAEEVERVAGTMVRELVESLTKPPTHVAEENQESRNAALLKQIRTAGTPAIFLKACDSMHNLSHPHSTPETLLKKAISKAELQYLPLVHNSPISSRFEEAYRHSIRVAETSVNNNFREGALLTRPSSLEDALQQAAAASTTKLLELHDVAEILRTTSSSANVVIWRQIAETSRLALQFATVHVEEPNIDIPEGVGLLEHAQELSHPLAMRLMGSRWRSDANRVTTVPMQLDAANKFVVAVEHVDSAMPNWWSCNVALVFVQFLAHRLIVSATDKRADLASEAVKQSLQFDVDLALAAGVRPSHLPAWKSWMTRCEQAIECTNKALFRFMGEGRISKSSRELSRVVSRLKEPNAIIRKMISSNRYSWPIYQDMEDIAGVRIILPTQRVVNLAEAFLTSESKDVGIRLHPTITRPRRDYVSEPPPSGYRAVHLVLEVDTYLPGEGLLSVPCEVQLRTIFQDLWAEISHSIVYRSSHTKRRKHGDAMKDISTELNRCEEALNQLLEKNGE